MPNSSTSIVVLEAPPQSIRANPVDPMTEKMLIRLLLPESVHGHPRDAVAFARIYYHWLGMSEILRWISPIGWEHPRLCPKKYPHGEKKYALAFGKLWITVWEALHQGTDRKEAMFSFEQMSREIGGILEPWGWGEAPGAVGQRTVARVGRKKGEKPETFIRRASGALRRGENPYLEGTYSYEFVRALKEHQSPQNRASLMAVADALTGIAKVMTGAKVMSNDTRYKKLKGSKHCLTWAVDRRVFYRSVEIEHYLVGTMSRLLGG
ncbi:hypothetical protein IQ266_18990 [filamentous cyanobacterium LEGE 11480]|uniref:Uncharacterized protein n=1 Tax=Romeriopsis navalis LEGE 11480 TaxID=2777977 RepID=A0A928VSP3_9CYAN|nr:hypothetical protein [Romeriopsis navalis]MBE9031825.1 hypothetical protein [Romeriopsis navalis LEGE 11480]